MLKIYLRKDLKTKCFTQKLKDFTQCQYILGNSYDVCILLLYGKNA